MEATIISAQGYINESIVAGKIANNDFTVTLSPEFDIDGTIYQVVIDGHHSLAAADEAGVDPVFEIADVTTFDAIRLLEDGDIEAFLVEAHVDTDYYDVTTGKIVF